MDEPPTRTPTASSTTTQVSLNSLIVGVFGSGAAQWLESHRPSIPNVTVGKKIYRVDALAEPTLTDGCIVLVSDKTMRNDLKKIRELDELGKPVIVLRRFLTDRKKTGLEKDWKTTDEEKEVWGLVTKAIVRQMRVRGVSKFDITATPVNMVRKVGPNIKG